MFTPILLLKYLERRINGLRSAGSLAAIRLWKFRRLVSLVNERSPYYSRLIRETGIDPRTCVPEDFPILTKRTVMEHFDEIVTEPGMRKNDIAAFLSRSSDPRELYRGHVVLHTSGSSGEIGYFVFSRADWARGIVQFSRGHPYSPVRRRAAYFGAVQGHFAGVTQFLTMERSFLGLLYRVRCFDINDPLRRTIDGLNAFQPGILTGYPSGLLMLARKQLSGELRIGPSSCECGGEPLAAGDREVIEDAFRCPVLNFYASTEHMLMAAGRPGVHDMVLCEDDLIFELHDDHTCVTNLFNRTLPLIRYRMEDVLRPLPDQSGRSRCRTIGEVVGRTEQALPFVNIHGEEDHISPLVLVEFHAKGLKRFQVRITGPASFCFRAVLQDGLTQADRDAVRGEIGERLRAILRQKEMENVSFVIEEVADLPVDPLTRKFKLIVR
jgi:phenylacetate-CoA ligase